MGITHAHRLKQVAALTKGFHSDEELAGFITALAMGKSYDQSWHAVYALLDDIRSVLIDQIFPVSPDRATELFRYLASHEEPKVRCLVAWFTDLCGQEPFEEIEKDLWRITVQDPDEKVRQRIVDYILGRHGNGTLGGNREAQLIMLLKAMESQLTPPNE